MEIMVDIVKKYGGIFISDEVQTAWGRTGSKWFGIEHWGVVPDVVTLGKGFGNGFPVTCVAVREQFKDAEDGGATDAEASLARVGDEVSCREVAASLGNERRKFTARTGKANPHLV